MHIQLYSPISVLVVELVGGGSVIHGASCRTGPATPGVLNIGMREGKKIGRKIGSRTKRLECRTLGR